jgi:hypothetical protein
MSGTAPDLIMASMQLPAPIPDLRYATARERYAPVRPDSSARGEPGASLGMPGLWRIC